jgi:hypothetical protein
MSPDMPLPRRYEVVVQCNRRNSRVGQQMIGELAADKSRPSDDEKTIAEIGTST